MGQEDPLEKGMTIHSRVVAWRIPRPEKPGGLQLMGSQESERTEQLTQRRTQIIGPEPESKPAGGEGIPKYPIYPVGAWNDFPFPRVSPWFKTPVQFSSVQSLSHV